ncbi:MAG: peptidoglycan DD-metalloendopeptidase family protein [Alphaproteobacteria bacterium]|nr:peptidoglycan DD-metalloendopeptidase family protein [Alphaproteobacteria bacterium]
MNKRCLNILIALPMFLSASLAQAASVSQTDVEALEQKSDQKKMEYKKLQAESVALSLELAKMNRELVEAAKRVQKDEDSITKTEEELKLLKDKLRVTEENFNKEYQNLASLLASIQNLALHPTDSLLFQPLTPVEVIQSAVLMRETVPELSNKASQLKADLEDLTAQKEALNQKLVELSNKTRDLKKRQETIKTLAVEKNKLREQLEGKTSQAKKEAVKLASEASDLRDLMEKAIKEAEIKRRKQEELKRAAHERELEAQRKLEEEQLKRLHEGRSLGFEGQDSLLPSDEQNYEVVKSAPAPKTPKITSSANLFIRPVRGDVITHYGQELSKGVNSKGIVFKTRDNAQVVAPYDGTIVFSGPFKGYGNLIIISHDDDIVSLIAGMKSIDTENGQMVLAGEPVGLMPDNQNAKLYMEIRKNKKPVNPLGWLGQ